MISLWSDIKYAFRQLLKNPGFTAVAVISLALAIGANTAVFSLYNAVMIRPLPVRQPHRLRVLNWVGDLHPYTWYCRAESTPDGQTKANVLSYPLYCALRDYAADKAEVFAFSQFDSFDPLTILVGNHVSTAHGLIVSGNFFQGLGLEARIGQTITPEHDRPQAEPVAVISDATWQRYFGGDPAVVGQSVTLNRHNFTIIGVLPKNFLGPLAGDRSDFYVPMSTQTLVRPSCSLTSNDIWWVQVMARLSPGISNTQLQTAMSTWFSRTVVAEGWGTSETPARIIVEDGSGGPLGSRHYIGKSLPILMGIAGIVLLAACANLVSLLLARGTSRQQEMAVRAALGAGRWRLVRQGLAESLLIASAGAVSGLLLANWGKHVLFHWLWPSQVVMDLGLDATVLGFTLLICLGSALLFGLIPAWRWSCVHLMASLKERSSSALSRMRLGKWMVSMQTALALLILVGAGLFIRTIVNLYHVDTGFKSENILVFNLDGRKADIKNLQLTDFYEQVRSSIAALPGVHSAAHSNVLMLSGWMNNSMAEVPGRSADDKMPILGLSVSDSFLSTMDISLLLGRDFTAMDNETAQPVVLVNETLARTAFPEQTPIGQTLTINQREYHIVGVFEDITYVGLKNNPEPTVFYHYRQQSGYPGKVFYEVRTASNPMSMVPAICQVIADINPNVPMADIKTQAIQLDESIANERCFAVLAMSLALLAVFLSCIGLFGLVSYHTTQRTGEIGIRKALGAQPWDVGFSVLRDALRLVLAGAVMGVPLVLVTSRLIHSYLFGIKPCDPATLVGAAILLFLVSVAAVCVPARRAAKIDPMEALRYE